MKRVLVVDDSATARMFVQRCLEIAGLSESEFLEAGNGREALVLMKSEGVDLLVTDLTMPDMDGIELLTHVAASPLLNGTPVLVVSSQTNPAVEETLKELGASAILRKPVSPHAVAEALEPLVAEDSP